MQLKTYFNTQFEKFFGRMCSVKSVLTGQVSCTSAHWDDITRRNPFRITNLPLKSRNDPVREIRAKQKILEIRKKVQVSISLLAHTAIFFKHIFMRSLQPARIVVGIIPITQTFFWYCLSLVQRLNQSQNRLLIRLIDGLNIIKTRYAKTDTMDKNYFLCSEPNMILFHL